MLLPRLPFAHVLQPSSCSPMQKAPAARKATQTDNVRAKPSGVYANDRGGAGELVLSSPLGLCLWMRTGSWHSARSSWENHKLSSWENHKLSSWENRRLWSETWVSGCRFSASSGWTATFWGRPAPPCSLATWALGALGNHTWTRTRRQLGQRGPCPAQSKPLPYPSQAVFLHPGGTPYCTCALRGPCQLSHHGALPQRRGVVGSSGAGIGQRPYKLPYSPR
mmetsp:Transcript_53012/g.123567  ORF Transcript_53012/g.123567 Transcript_53012/m.123567 type:complete len:222 (+) Transcript_53012:25-690(+)